MSQKVGGDCVFRENLGTNCIFILNGLGLGSG